MSGHLENLHSRIQSKSAVVGIIGLGYVGLPLVKTFIDAGFRCLGFDCDATKVERLQRGESYIAHLPGEWISGCIASGRFEPTADMSRLAEADCILICVPTPLTDSRDPDLSYVEQTARQIAAVLRPGQLVVLESTTYPGTTRDIVLPLLASGGRKPPDTSLFGNTPQLGRDFFLAYSPEREDPGNASFSTSRIPKVVGGMDEASRELAVALYSQAVVQVVPVSSCEVAEACKILENVYRAVNIAMVNELKMLFDRLDIDVWEVIAAAKTKPFGFQAFYPGPGLGGHCIPIDPFYLSWLARKHESPTRFIELAGEINSAMPLWVVNKIAAALSDAGKPIQRARIAILGIAYKKDVDDPRESPAFRIMELLEERGAALSYHDPHIPRLPTMRHYQVPSLSSQPLTAEYLADQDCVVIVTDHSAVDYMLVADHSPLVVDTRNAMEKVRRPGHNIWSA
ncbi:MAG: nucleotide sugar dehydrogenase [Pirellulaceae bacterium]